MMARTSEAPAGMPKPPADGRLTTSGLLPEVAGSPAAVRSTAEQDVTPAPETAPHKREAFMAREQRYQTLVDAIPQIVWTATPDGALDYSNQHWFDYTGMTLDETRGTGWQLVVHPDDLQRCVESWTHACMTGEPYEGEFRIKRSADGTYCWHLGRALPLRHADGHIIKWFGTYTDINAQKQAEVALRELQQEREALVTSQTSELSTANAALQREFHERERVETELHRVATIVESSADAIISCSLDGIIRTWNRGAQRLYGYSLSEAEGQMIDLIVPPEKRTNDRHQMERLKRGEIFANIETHRMKQDGSRFPVSLTLSPMRGPDGTVSGYSVITQDVTESKQAEARVQEMNAQLQSRVAELQTHTQELNLLNELSDMVQVCQTTKEAYEVMAASLVALFPDDAGMVAVLNASHDRVETVASWGGVTSARAFPAEACWALRRGRAYALDDAPGRLRCAHLARSPLRRYVCVPMMARGEMMGVFHLSSATTSSREIQHQLAQTVASQLALVLANFRLQESLRDQSLRDGLTGLVNRRSLERSLERGVQRVTRLGQPLSILMLDLDHFKHFNDTYGHGAGDQLLRAAGHLLQANIRGEDIACRYGGEEFLVVLPGASAETAQRRAEVIRVQLKMLQIDYLGQSLPAVTCSIGIAVFPDNGKTLQEITEQADQALYQAKQAGRDRIMLLSAVEPTSQRNNKGTPHAANIAPPIQA